MMNKQLIEKVLDGDAKTASRLMRDIDDDAPDALIHLKQLYPHTGRAHIIGLTGAPGAGKSTLLDGLIRHLRGQGKTVGVLAIDPTSPFSGGAILGDRIRMQHHAGDTGVFIKSIATRGQTGGLSRSAFGITAVLDAMGKDVVLIETVGAGQDEVDIIGLAHTLIVVVIPNMGDGMQTVKSGIMETADIFALNKADHEGAGTARGDIDMMLDMRSARKTSWKPRIVQTVATQDQGLEELLEQVQRHWQWLQAGGLTGYRRKKAGIALMILFRRLLWERSLSILDMEDAWQDMVESVLGRETDPYSAAAELVDRVMGKSEHGKMGT